MLMLKVIAAAMLLVSPAHLWAQSGETTPTADWPQWRGIHRDGHVSDLPQTMPPMKVLWKHPVAGVCDAGIAVTAGRVFMADRDERNDFYRCLDARSGTEIWVRSFPNTREMDYGAGPRATPLVHRDRVYALSAFGELFCFDSRTGKTVWQKDFLKDFGADKVPKWGYCSSPLVTQGKLVVSPGGKAAIVALDPETGKTLWNGAGTGSNYSSLIVGVFGGVEQIVGHDDASLGGWEVATGKRLWSIAMEQVEPPFIVPTPVNVGGKLLVTDQKNETQLFAFGKAGLIVEQPIAKSEEIAPEVVTPVAVGDLILGQSKKLICLDASNKLVRLWAEGARTFKADCHLIVTQDRGLAFNKRGEVALFSFDRKGVKVLGEKKLCRQTPMHPTLADGRLYVRDGEFLYCYDLSDGQ